MKQYAVIMAGGTGSRLWPVSREKKPKQFICVDGEQSMLAGTIQRIGRVVPPQNIYVVTSRDLTRMTRKTLKDQIPDSNIIIEPNRKNTAACISYTALLLLQRLEKGTVCFFPADGYVQDVSAYADAVGQVYTAAENSDGLVILGIEPSFPATGYGYINVCEKSDEGTYPVKKFVEKPDRATAKKFLVSGGYLWNSGIVAGKLEVLAAQIRKYLPVHYQVLTKALEKGGKKNLDRRVRQAYQAIPSLSFDKGVLEQSEKILAVKGCYDWDDIGSLDRLSVTFCPDSNGNKVKGKFFGMDTHDCVIYGTKPLIAAIGVQDLIMVATDDAVFVCPKDRVQDVKRLTERLKLSEYKKYV
jgi:mannose-1-phosphate guanylyltransferase